MRKIWGSLLLIEEDASLVAPEHSFQNSVTFFLGQLFDCTKANFVPLATRQPTWLTCSLISSKMFVEKNILFHWFTFHTLFYNFMSFCILVNIKKQTHSNDGTSIPCRAWQWICLSKVESLEEETSDRKIKVRILLQIVIVRPLV